MAMAFAEDDVHRLLPREILADIGVADGVGGATTAVDELAARLVGILGLDRQKQQRALGLAPPCARRLDQGNGLAPRDAQAAASLQLRFQPPLPPPLFFFAADHPPLAPTRTSGGTGVFLPRAEEYLPPPQSRAAAASVANAKPPRMMRKEQEAAMAAAAAAREQHLIQLQLRAMAAEMAVLRAGWPPAALLAPPPQQQWTY